MSKEIKEYDDRGNLIYQKKYIIGKWYEYDKNNNMIHYKSTLGIEYWQEYDENNNVIYYKYSDGDEYWYKYGENNIQINITEQEYKEIEFRKKEKEYNSRTKCSRFEIMEI